MDDHNKMRVGCYFKWLTLVDSNHHVEIQSFLCCHYTKGQIDYFVITIVEPLEVDEINRMLLENQIPQVQILLGYNVYDDFHQ